MRNAVPDLANELAGRALAGRRASYADEVRRVIMRDPRLTSSKRRVLLSVYGELTG